MTLSKFIEKLNTHPEAVAFDETLQVIADNYHFQPTAFENAPVYNVAGSNEGSCKIFAFAKLQGLSQSQTLACFGKYYREDVLQHPQAEDHANIRQFMLTGMQGIDFKGSALDNIN
jgi:hypothetical protein